MEHSSALEEYIQIHKIFPSALNVTGSSRGKVSSSSLNCSPSSSNKSTHSNIFIRGLTMASLNINSLRCHIDDLRIFMYDTNIDAQLIKRNWTLHLLIMNDI